MKRSFLFLALFMSLAVAGCATVGPDYVPSEMSVRNNWSSRLQDGWIAKDVDPQTLAGWWRVFEDPQLSSLIERAVAGNLDVKNARARVREARAKRGVARADLFPMLDATGSATWSRGSRDDAGPTGSLGADELYSASFDAGWELDIFGGVRRSIEAATADLQASEEGVRDVLVSLTAEVALNYIEVRTYQTRVSVAEENVRAQRDTYQLTLWRHEAGLSDALAVQQARYNLESTRSEIPTLRAGLEEAVNRIAVLLGEQPGRVHEELEERGPIPAVPAEIAVGVPAAVLQRRPDIRRAERQLAAQTARVGVATADLYPKIHLNGSIGLESLSMSGLSSAGAWSLAGGPQLSWAVFKAGAIRQNIEAQCAVQEQTLIAYEAAVLGALEEVENALVAYATEQQRREVLKEAAQAAQRAAELAQDKYQAGVTDFVDVLETQRSLLAFQDELARSDGEVAANLVRLYKALGGGWEPPSCGGRE